MLLPLPIAVAIQPARIATFQELKTLELGRLLNDSLISKLIPESTTQGNKVPTMLKINTIRLNLP